MPKEESLLLLLLALDNPNASHKIHHLSVLVVKQVVPALVTSVTVDPFQAKLVVRSGPVPVDHLANNYIHRASHVINNHET